MDKVRISHPKVSKKTTCNWQSIFQICAVLLFLVFYGGLILFIDIQENGNLSAIFKNDEKMLTKVLMALAHFVK